MADISDREVTAVPAPDPADPAVGRPPHPVLDVPVEEEKISRSRGMDWVVFGVTAAIAIGFLVWGFGSTETMRRSFVARRRRLCVPTR